MTVEHLTPNPNPIAVVGFEHEAIESEFLQEINESYDELKLLLPSLPETLRVHFGASYDYGETGMTGSATGADSIKVGIDPQVQHRTHQHERIRPLVFHEGYHVAQGFHLGNQFSALESAIFEGCATVFERDYAHSLPKWGQYQEEGDEKLLSWSEAMKSITADQYFEPSGETWQKWAFYDPETKESWRIYKVGTWIVDSVMNETGLTALDLNRMSAEEILELWNARR